MPSADKTTRQRSVGRGIRAARRDDVADLSEVLAAAFFDDPVQRWLFPNDGRRGAQLRHFYRLDLRHRLVSWGTTLTDPELATAACWLPPNAWQIGLWTRLRLAPAFLSLAGPRAIDALSALRTIEQRHLAEPHWYLAHLATDPTRRSEGLAAAVLRPVLRRCAREALPAYLESSREDNVGYYGRFGFEVLERVELRGGPPVWLMWRKPGSDTGVEEPT